MQAGSPFTKSNLTNGDSMDESFLPEAPGAKAARNCGIWALVSNFLCCFPASIALGIIAIVQNTKAKRFARAEPDQYQTPSNAGTIMGVIALVLLPLLLPMIGIVSAIAIPALVGQRARARDKASISNAIKLVSDYASEYDKLTGHGASRQEILQDFEVKADRLNETTKNPWDIAAPALSKTIAIVQDADEESIQGLAQKQATELGQVHLVVQFPEKGHHPGYLASSVQLQNPVNGERVIVKVVPLD